MSIGMGFNQSWLAIEWLVLTGNRWNLDLKRLAPLLSAEGQVVAGEVSETVMFSKTELWRDGRIVWCVSHDCEKDDDDLTVTGEPPSELAAIAAHLAKERAEGDERVDVFFEGPLSLSLEVCGYSPRDAIFGPWTLLARGAARKRAATSGQAGSGWLWTRIAGWRGRR